MPKLRFVGLDVHAETIAVAVAEAGGGEVRSYGTIPNRPESVRKLIRKHDEDLPKKPFPKPALGPAFEIDKNGFPNLVLERP